MVYISFFMPVKYCFDYCSFIVSEKAMAPHSSTFAWKMPWTEEPGGLQSMGLLRVGYDWATSLSLFTFMHWRSKWQPTPVFLPGGSQGRGSLVGCRLWGGTELDWLKRLSSSSMSDSCDPMDCSLPGSSVHGIFEARVPEWGAIAFSVWRVGYLLLYETGHFHDLHSLTPNQSIFRHFPS